MPNLFRELQSDNLLRPLAFSEPNSRTADILTTEANDALAGRGGAFAAGSPNGEFHDYIRIGVNGPVGEPP
jgi:hypothetical protein